MGKIVGEEIGRYDPYTDKFIKNTTTDRIEIGTDGNLYRLSVSNGNEFLPMDRLYTKADLVAMLEEISLEIDEMDCTIDHDFEGYYTGHVDCQKLIQQKINSLKEA